MADTTGPTRDLQAFLDDPRFHREFVLPADQARGRDGPLRVTYSDFGFRDEQHPEEERVLLFFGPMTATRMLQTGKDELAKKHKIRIINTDRPGFGGIEDVSYDKRLVVWRDVVPALLQHLGIKHVSAACQSGGTVYLMDMLLHHPELLDPKRPYIALGGPWVHPAHTGVTALALADTLPSGLVGQLDKVVAFLHQLTPVASMSTGLSNVLSGLWSSPSTQQGTVDEHVLFEEELWPKVLDRIHENGIKGISTEANLLLQRGEETKGWADWGDYDKLVPRVREALKARGAKLTIDVFFAETDALIGDGGTKGPAWLDSCWKGDDDGVVEYTSRVIKGTDHDSIWHLRWGAIQTVLEKIAGFEQVAE